MALTRYIILGIFVLSAGVTIYFGEQLLFPEKSDFPRDSFEYVIDTDLIDLKHTENFKFFNNLKSVHLSDHRVQKINIDWQKIFASHFKDQPQSHHLLQIDLFDSGPDQTSHEENILIIQFNVIDDLSHNKIWEMSRTYRVPKFTY